MLSGAERNRGSQREAICPVAEQLRPTAKTVASRSATTPLGGIAVDIRSGWFLISEATSARLSEPTRGLAIRDALRVGVSQPSLRR